jgi:hypothetical protein
MDHRAGASHSRLRRSLLQLGDTILQEFINAPHGVVLVAQPQVLAEASLGNRHHPQAARQVVDGGADFDVPGI